MSKPTLSKRYVLKNPPTDLPVLDGPDATFELQTQDLPPLKENQVLVKTLHISHDPAQRGWIQKGVDPARMYVPPVPVGEVMRSRNVCKVLDSTTPDYKAGDIVLAGSGWSDYNVIDRSKVDRKLEQDSSLSYTHYLGSLGFTGLTAYYGIKEIARAGKDDTVVVSGAAGATGSMVVQLAKHVLNCKRVIGIAGSPEKIKWVESLGADICLNYKDTDFANQLVKATDGYVDVYFDNVGGDILDLMLTRMKRHGRIAACGAITQYNKGEKDGIKNWFEVVSNRIEIRGLIVLDFVAAGKAPAATAEMVQAFKEGKIKIDSNSETVVETKVEDIPKVWMGLFEGKNTGKLVSTII